MVIIVKHGTSRKRVRELIRKLRSSNTRSVRPDIFKHCGVLKLKEDPLVLQKRWRAEWE